MEEVAEADGVDEVKKDDEQREIVRRGPRVWDDEAISILRDLYQDHLTEDVAIIIGTTRNATTSMAYKLGLKKSPKGLRVANEASMANGAAKAWFTQGHVSWNTGVKGFSSENSRNTQFKKGALPHNTKDRDGVITIRNDNRGVPQKFIRVALGKWVPLARYVWTQANGDIPKGMCVRIIDGDTMNCRIENIELVSIRLNMLLNSKHQYSREIAEVRETLCELKSTIKQKIDENKHE